MLEHWLLAHEMCWLSLEWAHCSNNKSRVSHSKNSVLLSKNESTTIIYILEISLKRYPSRRKKKKKQLHYWKPQFPHLDHADKHGISPCSVVVRMKHSALSWHTSSQDMWGDGLAHDTHLPHYAVHLSGWLCPPSPVTDTMKVRLIPNPLIWALGLKCWTKQKSFRLLWDPQASETLCSSLKIWVGDLERKIEKGKFLTSNLIPASSPKIILLWHKAGVILSESVPKSLIICFHPQGNIRWILQELTKKLQEAAFVSPTCHEMLRTL